MATRITKLELSQALAERNAQLEAARLRIAELEGDVMALKSCVRDMENAAVADGCTRTNTEPARAPVVVRTGPRPVIEFDPRIVGDFRRAMNAARECGGVVRRVQH